MASFNNNKKVNNLSRMNFPEVMSFKTPVLAFITNKYYT